jgi:hypothetical protein
MREVLRTVTVVIIGLCLAGGALAWAQEKPKPPVADPISGSWEGTVELPDGAVPFTMTLKLDGAKVTGEIGSPQGNAPITEGSWADGSLTIAFTFVDGAAIQMTGAVTNGALGGSLSYGGGQMVVTWAAKKKVDK